MARGPITWRNVAINDGSGSASLGASAAGFGRTALQGLDIFNNQMQDRIDREDQLLTNDAIATALRGGPQVANNRRVDANALQLAVERRAQGIRSEQAHETDLVTAGLDQTGQKLDNEIAQKDVNNYDENLRLQRERDAAQIAHQQQQTRESKARMDEAERQLAASTRIRGAARDYNTYLLDPNGRDAELRAEFDKLGIKDSAAPDYEQTFQGYREDRIGELRNDADYGARTARRFGFDTVREWVDNTDEGQQWATARQAVLEQEVADATQSRKAAQATSKAAAEFVGGDKTKLVRDASSSTGFGFGKGVNINATDQKVVARDLGLDPKDDDVKELIAKVNSEFKDAGAFKYAMEYIVGDEEEVPDNADERIEKLAFDAKTLAEISLNPRQSQTQGATAAERARNRVRAQEQNAEAEAAGSTVPAPTKKEESLAEAISDLGLDLSIHPDRDRKDVVDEIKVLADRVKTGRRNGGRLPLSTQELARARTDLERAIERVATPPLGALPAGVDIRIQPK